MTVAEERPFSEATARAAVYSDDACILTEPCVGRDTVVVGIPGFRNF
jgi:hypothetical protein